MQIYYTEENGVHALVDRKRGLRSRTSVDDEADVADLKVV